MLRGIGGRDLVVEQAWEDETDARAPGASDVREDFLERGYCHGDYIAQDDDRCGDSSEAGVAHRVTSRRDAGFRGCDE